MQQCSIFLYILAVSVCPCLLAVVVALDLLLRWGVKVLEIPMTACGNGNLALRHL